MKKAEEYFEKIPYSFDIPNIKEWVCDQIRCAQKDAIKEAVQACADNADADYTFTGNRDENSDIEVYVIKSSILEVADKLIKELE